MELCTTWGVADLCNLIRDVPDFPKKGIVFKDITPLLGDAAGLALAVEYLAQPFRGKNITKVIGAESRGFIFGTAVAQALSAGFVPIRKPGKLPRATSRETYTLEYGMDELHIHQDAVLENERVLIIDDLLATGGTIAACCRLVESLGGQIEGVAFLIELAFLKGRQKIAQHPVHSVIRYNE